MPVILVLVGFKLEHHEIQSSLLYSGILSQARKSNIHKNELNSNELINFSNTQFLMFMFSSLSKLPIVDFITQDLVF